MYKELSAPVAVQMEFTEKCTHKCVHCYNYWREERGQSGNNLNFSDMENIIEQIIQAKIFRVVATGGEPLLNKKVLFEALGLLKSAGIITAINSNLATLTEEDAYCIKSLGVSSVLTSIAAHNAEIHDDIVQYRGAFNNTIRGLSMLRRIGVPVTVNMVVSKKNNHLVKETAELVKSLGLHSFYATKAGCPGNCNDFSGMHLSSQEFDQYLEDLYLAQDEDFSIGVLERYPLCAIKDLSRYHFAVNRRCLAGVTTLTIGTDGNIRPCPHLDSVCGNILNQGIADIWTSMEKWRNKDALSDTCKNCELINQCGGGCKMEAKMAGGDDPYICLDNLEQVKEQYRNLQRSSTDVTLPECFRLNPNLKWRKEAFGSIALANSQNLCYLDAEATDPRAALNPNGRAFCFPRDL